MIAGRVSADLDALIPIIVLSRDGHRQSIEALIDTGFDGDVALPAWRISQLGLSIVSHTLVTLGDGRETVLACYRAGVGLGDAEPRDALVMEVEGTPLVGMGSLNGASLRIEAWNNGVVGGMWRESGPFDCAFDYRLESVGWGILRARIGDESFHCCASWVGDALGPFAAAAVSVHDTDEVRRFSWYEEPGEWAWVLTPHRERVLVEIRHYADHLNSEDPGYDLFVGEIGRRDFVGAVYLALDRFLQAWGVEGYRRLGGLHPFPIHDFTRLHDIVTPWLKEM